MADVRPFRAYRYNLDALNVGEDTSPTLDALITPPFDVITPEERIHLVRLSRYNYARIILPEDREGMDKYTAAGLDFQAWIDEGVLARDNEDSFYLLKQTFQSLDGQECTRRAFFAVTKIPEPGEGTILGHERTFDWKVTDRLRLTEATRANLGAVFVLYDDPRRDLSPFLNQMEERPPDGIARTIDRVTQQIWRVPADPRVTAFFRDKKLYIADGHHRYRTAHTYRDRMRLAERPSGLRTYDFVLMGFVALEDPGLFVYPAHRVLNAPAGFDPSAFLKAIEKWFDVARTNGSLIDQVRAQSSCAIGLVLKGGEQFLLRLRDGDRITLLGEDHGPAWRDLDVAVLHGGILERILGLPDNAEFVYEKDPAAAVNLVRSGQKDMAFLLRNMDPAQVCACAEAREQMPQKATYFYPKLPSGAVVYRHE